MANIVLQDLTAMIHHTSRFNGNQFDSVHVEIFLQTDTPLTPDMQWFIPNGSSVPPEVLAIFKATNLAMYPMSEASIMEGTQDIQQQANEQNLQEVERDAAKLMLRAISKKQSFTPISGSSNTYLLAYDYKLFPLKDTTLFEFKVVLPFDGLGMPPQSKVQMSVILPIGSNLEPNATQGIAINGQPIQELMLPIGNTGRKVVSFEYSNVDPSFNITYIY